ncbi:hypothetical protein HY449_01690 [Candidatus Pacearchaeota archaeon]|nr:hypothetical protein [Candidatus Pacearchaeota archaeon]
MDIVDYITNRTSDYTSDLQQEYLGWYKKHWYSSVGLAFLSAYSFDEMSSKNLSLLLGVATGLTIFDLVVRGISGNKGNKPAGGLVGLLRNLVSKEK